MKARAPGAEGKLQGCPGLRGRPPPPEGRRGSGPSGGAPGPRPPAPAAPLVLSRTARQGAARSRGLLSGPITAPHPVSGRSGTGEGRTGRGARCPESSCPARVAPLRRSLGPREPCFPRSPELPSTPGSRRPAHPSVPAAPSGTCGRAPPSSEGLSPEPQRALGPQCAGSGAAAAGAGAVAPGGGAGRGGAQRQPRPPRTRNRRRAASCAPGWEPGWATPCVKKPSPTSGALPAPSFWRPANHQPAWPSSIPFFFPSLLPTFLHPFIHFLSDSWVRLHHELVFETLQKGPNWGERPRERLGEREVLVEC